MHCILVPLLAGSQGLASANADASVLGKCHDLLPDVLWRACSQLMPWLQGMFDAPPAETEMARGTLDDSAHHTVLAPKNGTIT